MVKFLYFIMLFRIGYYGIVIRNVMYVLYFFLELVVNKYI